MSLPCSIVLLLDRGYDVINGSEERDGLLETIPPVRELIASERSHIANYAHFTLYFPNVNVICQSIENGLTELEETLQSIELDNIESLSQLLSTVEENAIAIASFQLALDGAVNEIPRQPPVPTLSDAIFALSSLLRCEVSYDIVPYWLKGMGEFKRQLAMDLAAARILPVGKEKLVEGLEEVITLLEESEYLFSRYERERNIPDLEQLIATLGKAGDRFYIILPEIEEILSISSSDSAGRYLDILSLMTARYREGDNLINEIRCYTSYLKELEETKNESLKKEKIYWYLHSYRQEQYFRDLSQFCSDKIGLLEAIHLHLDEPFEISRLFSDYYSMCSAERSRLLELRRELEEDSLESAPYFRNLSNVLKGVFQCRLPLHHLATHLAHLLRMQEDIKDSLTDYRLLDHEKSGDPDTLLQAVRLHEEGAEKIKKYLQRREKDLLIDGRNLIIEGTKLITSLKPVDNSRAAAPMDELLRKFSVIPEIPNFLIDFKDTRDDSGMPDGEPMNENIWKLKQALMQGECGEISIKEEKRIFEEFLHKVTLIRSQLELQASHEVKPTKDPELETNFTILNKATEELQSVAQEIIRLIGEGAFPPASYYCSRIEEAATRLDKLLQSVKKIMGEKHNL
ncbi:MAG: hypothetical protein AB2L14_32640 [Candidatus Xenobiia bacterium LiM19]